MNVKSAEAVVMPFGKYKGATLGEIADADVLYLDWLVGRDIRGSTLREAVAAICQDRAAEIKRLVDDAI